MSEIQTTEKKLKENIKLLLTKENVNFILGTTKNGQQRSVYSVVKDLYVKPKKNKNKKKNSKKDNSYSLFLDIKKSKNKRKKKKNKHFQF